VVAVETRYICLSAILWALTLLTEQLTIAKTQAD
jgi:hypothetical protein